MTTKGLEVNGAYIVRLKDSWFWYVEVSVLGLSPIRLPIRFWFESTAWKVCQSLQVIIDTLEEQEDHG